MGQITYTDKVDSLIRAGVNEINKITAMNMNEIKTSGNDTNVKANTAITNAATAQSTANTNENNILLKANETDTGDKANLTTTAKSTIVAGINEVDSKVSLLTTGSDAFTHAKRGLVNGFEVERLIPLDDLIEDNYTTPFLFQAGFSKGTSKLGVAIPDIAAADFSYTGGAIPYIDKYGNAQTTAANEPAFDWSTGIPLLKLDGSVSGRGTGDISSIIDSTSFVFSFDAFFTETANTSRISASDGSSLNRLFVHPSSDGVVFYSVISNSPAYFALDIVLDLDKLNYFQIKSKENDSAIRVNGVLVYLNNSIAGYSPNAISFLKYQGSNSSDTAKGNSSGMSIKSIETFNSTSTTIEEVKLSVNNYTFR